MNPPPFYISYSDKETFKSALPDSVRKEYWEEIENLINEGLPPAVSHKVIAAMFSYTPKFVSAMAHNPEKYYRRFTIPKGKGKREIFAPKIALKVIQKWIGHHLSKAMIFEDHVYGFIPGRSAPMAAQVHCNAEWVYSIDIKDFFPSTKDKLVINMLEAIGYTNDAAKVIVSLCCYNDALAQGSPASPVISNITFKEVDKELIFLSKKYNVNLTRYADDITYSGKGEPPRGLAEDVKALIKKSGWEIAEDKEHLVELPLRLKVHGLLVHNEKPRLTKGYRNRIRAYKHLLEKGLVKEEDEEMIKGHIYYAKSIDAL